MNKTKPTDKFQPGKRRRTERFEHGVFHEPEIRKWRQPAGDHQQHDGDEPPITGFIDAVLPFLRARFGFLFGRAHHYTLFDRGIEARGRT